MTGILFWSLDVNQCLLSNLILEKGNFKLLKSVYSLISVDRWTSCMETFIMCLKYPHTPCVMQSISCLLMAWHQQMSRNQQAWYIGWKWWWWLLMDENDRWIMDELWKWRNELWKWNGWIMKMKWMNHENEMDESWKGDGRLMKMVRWMMIIDKQPDIISLEIVWL